MQIGQPTSSSGRNVGDSEISNETSAQVLQFAIAQSQFVLLGENHRLVKTPKFRVCNAAGPAQLAAFEKKYPESINIYNTREEFEMLSK